MGRNLRPPWHQRREENEAALRFGLRRRHGLGLPYEAAGLIQRCH